MTPEGAVEESPSCGVSTDSSHPNPGRSHRGSQMWEGHRMEVWLWGTLNNVPSCLKIWLNSVTMIDVYCSRVRRFAPWPWRPKSFLGRAIWQVWQHWKCPPEQVNVWACIDFLGIWGRVISHALLIFGSFAEFLIKCVIYINSTGRVT